MSVDILFEEYKRKKAEADKQNTKDVALERLLNEVAEEARNYCMRSVYWNRKREFFRHVDEDEAHSIFNEIFPICLERGSSGKTSKLSGALNFYFYHHLLDYMRKQKRNPLWEQHRINNPEEKSEDFLDSLINKDVDHGIDDPESGIRTREMMKGYLDTFDTFPRFQRDALILNANGFSHADIAYFLDVEKTKVSKQKFNARQKLREKMHGEE